MSNRKRRSSLHGLQSLGLYEQSNGRKKNKKNKEKKEKNKNQTNVLDRWVVPKLVAIWICTCTYCDKKNQLMIIETLNSKSISNKHCWNPENSQNCIKLNIEFRLNCVIQAALYGVTSLKPWFLHRLRDFYEFSDFIIFVFWKLNTIYLIWIEKLILEWKKNDTFYSQ